MPVISWISYTISPHKGTRKERRSSDLRYFGAVQSQPSFHGRGLVRTSGTDECFDWGGEERKSNRHGARVTSATQLDHLEQRDCVHAPCILAPPKRSGAHACACVWSGRRNVAETDNFSGSSDLKFDFYDSSAHYNGASSTCSPRRRPPFSDTRILAA